MKRCNKCGIDKVESDFYSRKDTVTGLKGTCKSCDLEVMKRYQKTETSILAVRKRVQGYYKKFPDRRSARIAVHNAIASGKLAALPCMVCGEAKSEAHHADYSNKLGVTWLCKKHHVEAHELGKELRRNNV